MIGNTLNIGENGPGEPCSILTQSSADLNLAPDQIIIAAYLYWAGSSSLAEADLNIKMNGIDVSAERTFTTTIGGSDLDAFGAFSDITSIVQAAGSGTYTVSDFDLTSVIFPYCYDNGGGGTNFGGWSVLVVYNSENLSYNLVNIYDGFSRVDQSSVHQQMLFL